MIDFFESSVTFVSQNLLFAASPILLNFLGSVFYLADAKSEFENALEKGTDVDGGFLAEKLKTFIYGLTGLGAVACFAGCVFAGVQLGISSFTQNSQSRMGAIVSIFFAVLGAFIILNAEGIIASVPGMTDAAGAIFLFFRN